MDKSLLRSHMVRYGDTQKALAMALGVSLSGINAKINATGGAEFKQTEIGFIKNRYALSAREVDQIFFASKMSQKDKIC